MNRKIEVLRVAGHSIAATVHVFGIVDNWQEAETWKDRDVIIHGIALTFSLIALGKHIRRLA